MSEDVRAFLLAAGRGIRFLPVTERIPKPLFPYLNVPLAVAHLARLRAFGVSEAAVNLHHLGHQIEQHLVDRSAELPKLRFFPETRLLGTAGGLRNARSFLSSPTSSGSRDILVVNSDAAIEPDFGSLLTGHRKSGRPATLLVVENREPERYTPLQAEGDRITGFGTTKPLGPIDRSAGVEYLYTGVCVLDSRVLELIPRGETSLVDHLWNPLLDRGEEIGYVLHEGPFADLGRPSDFLRASLEALSRGGSFPEGAGRFDESSRILARSDPSGTGAGIERCVIGDAAIAAGARLTETVVWDGTAIDSGARLTRCILAGGLVAGSSDFEDALLWGAPGETVAAWPIHGGRGAHGFQPGSPRR